MRCSKLLDSESDESDEEIRALKRKIKEKKLRKRISKIEAQNAFSERSTSSNSRSTSSFFSDSTFSSSYSSSATGKGKLCWYKISLMSCHFMANGPI